MLKNSPSKKILHLLQLIITCKRLKTALSQHPHFQVIREMFVQDKFKEYPQLKWINLTLIHLKNHHRKLHINQ